MNPTEPLKAPWDERTLLLLNVRQQMGWLTPYRCPNGCEIRPGTLRVPGTPLLLIATPEGWVCPGCQYKQDWARPIDITMAADAVIRNPDPTL